jgi:hypothetical protein
MDTGEIRELAKEIHKRHLILHGDSDKWLAMAEATVLSQFNMTLDLDMFGWLETSLLLKDSNDRKFTCSVLNDQGLGYVDALMVQACDLIAFYDKRDNSISWLDCESILESPFDLNFLRHTINKKATTSLPENSSSFIDPSDVKFGVWDYEAGLWENPNDRWFYAEESKRISKINAEIDS